MFFFSVCPTMLSLCHYTKYTVLSDDSVRHILIAINIVSLLIAAPGNIITIVVIARVRRLRKQPTYILISSVCLADALVAAITQPMYIAILMLESSDEHCTVYRIFFVIAWLSGFGRSNQYGYSRSIPLHQSFFALPSVHDP